MALLPSCWVPGAVLDKLASVAVKTDCGVENQVKRVQNREEDDHPSGDVLGFDLVGDPKSSNQADNTVTRHR